MNRSLFLLSNSPEEDTELALIEHAAKRIEFSLERRKTGATLQAAEVRALLGILDFHACREDWDKIVELSSRAVVIGCGRNASFRLYNIWVEALHRANDVGNLQALAKHLLKQREDSVEALAIALKALLYSGRMAFANVVFSHLQKSDHRNPYVYEARAVRLCESLDRTLRIRGVKMLQTLSTQKYCNYFTLGNLLRYATESELYATSSETLKTMYDRYPGNAESQWAAANLAMGEKKWNEALEILQKQVSLNENNGMCWLSIAYCYENMGDLKAAENVLRAARPLFDANDYEFNTRIGTVYQKLHSRYGYAELRGKAIRHLGSALQFARKVGMSDSALQLMLFELRAGIGESTYNRPTAGSESAEKKRYWVLAVNPEDEKMFMSENDLLLRCPKEFSNNDVVFLGRHPSGTDRITCDAVFSANSPVVADRNLGPVTRITRRKFFPGQVNVALEKALVPVSDIDRCQNFSIYGRALYYSIDQSMAENIIAQAERMDEANNSTRGRHAV